MEEEDETTSDTTVSDTTRRSTNMSSQQAPTITHPIVTPFDEEVSAAETPTDVGIVREANQKKITEKLGQKVSKIVETTEEENVNEPQKRDDQVSYDSESSPHPLQRLKHGKGRATEHESHSSEEKHDYTKLQWHIDSILNRRERIVRVTEENGDTYEEQRVEFLVKWKGDYKDSWEPMEHLDGCLESVYTYLKKHTYPSAFLHTTQSSQELEDDTFTKFKVVCPCSMLDEHTLSTLDVSAKDAVDRYLIHYSDENNLLKFYTCRTQAEMPNLSTFEIALFATDEDERQKEACLFDTYIRIMQVQTPTILQMIFVVLYRYQKPMYLHDIMEISKNIFNIEVQDVSWKDSLSRHCREQKGTKLFAKKKIQEEEHYIEVTLLRKTGDPLSLIRASRITSSEKRGKKTTIKREKK
jgi:hypothetical protein